MEGKTYCSNNEAIGFEVSHSLCPNCNELIVILKSGDCRWIEDQPELINTKHQEILYPKFSRRATDQSIPQSYRDDFDEATALVNISPKASAALSRRLLQQLLRQCHGIKPSDLNKEIEAFVETHSVPAYVADAIDVIRVVGNFAAHPVKYQNADRIAEVEQGEAEWLVEVLYDLLEWTFVQPSRRQSRIDRLNAKLKDLGKPPLKQPHKRLEESSGTD
ncbi:MAG: DUF4145 domain-containing protein [Chloroflexi bacterium]|nr:DUF4145 domain-containing protein [Chloroflexota bacterium]